MTELGGALKQSRQHYYNLGYIDKLPRHLSVARSDLILSFFM